ncbi:hypothetical protein [Pseudomonas syringae]|uniref:hypothetical protein n=1 Tax=Pseudomonas syringae TaxID=317 RepID=UPI00067C9EEA|nr:hypothetical protein [Pseudomonas syringae]
MSDCPRSGPLLPNEPRILDWAHEQMLTEHHLLPHLAALELLFQSLRAGLDGRLSQAQPVKLGKPYPLGQCLEISRATEHCLTQLNNLTMHGAAAQGQAALLAFLLAGGSARQVWGDLRGEYFQNAFVIGTLYVDVSNDTVFSHKPKVEILPFNEARLVPVGDFQHFIKVVRSYWKAEVFPNHILPSLAPYFPLIVAIPGGSVRLEGASNYMFALTQTNGLRPSEAVLDSPSMSDDMFRLLSQRLIGCELDLAADQVQGKARALQKCREFRNDRATLSAEQCTQIIAELRLANHRLSSLMVGFTP